MRLIKRLVKWIAVGGLLSPLGCGVEEASQYSDGKQFVDGTQPVDNSADAIPEVPQELPPATVDRNVSNETDEEVDEIDPNEVVLNNRYRAKFDVGTALRLVDGKAADDSLGLARSTIEDRLNGVTDKDGLLVSQAYGDGVSRSVGTQMIINTPGDSELADGQDSNSGIQTYDRVTNDPSCPSGLLCIDRVTFEPTIGESMTFCYSDAAGKRVSIPYAIPPTTKYAEFTELANTYGPYIARRYRVSDMDCNQPVTEPDVTETFVTELRAGLQPSASTSSFFQRAGAFKADYEGIMINRRVDGDNKAPYIDETIKLQMQTRYVFDNSQSVLVKMIKTVRSSVELPFPVNLIMSMDGLQVDLHFELCENLLNEADGSYCNP